MYLNVIDQQRQNVLSELIKNNPVPDSYLAGGTALALQLGHRLSYDFDFFSISEFNVDDIWSAISNIGKAEILYSRGGTFHGLLDGINITWLHYPNPVLGEFLLYPEIPAFKIASLLDIGLMKWAAISSRGSRRDFVDMYFVCKYGLELKYLLSLLDKKFPQAKINLYHMVSSICYFDDAEEEVMPEMLMRTEWEEIKKYFIYNQKKLMESITDRK